MQHCSTIFYVYRLIKIASKQKWQRDLVEVPLWLRNGKLILETGVAGGAGDLEEEEDSTTLPNRYLVIRGFVSDMDRK